MRVVTLIGLGNYADAVFRDGKVVKIRLEKNQNMRIAQVSHRSMCININEHTTLNSLTESD